MTDESTKEESASGEAAERVEAEAGSRNTLTAEQPRGGRPLVLAEDDDAIRELLAETFAAQGHPVHPTANGAAAFACIQSLGCPTLVVVDLGMPVMTGYELVERLHQQMPGMHRVIVATAVPDAHRAVRSPCVVAIVQKPFSLARLVELVRRFSSADGDVAPSR